MSAFAQSAVQAYEVCRKNRDGSPRPPHEVRILVPATSFPLGNGRTVEARGWLRVANLPDVTEWGGVVGFTRCAAVRTPTGRFATRTSTHPVYSNANAFETCGLTFRYRATSADTSGVAETVKPILTAWETATVVTDASLALSGTVGEQSSETRISSDQLAILRGTTTVARIPVEWQLDSSCKAELTADRRRRTVHGY